MIARLDEKRAWLALVCVASIATLLVLAPGRLRAGDAAPPTLERVVMVSRHGVRAPTRSTTLLNTLTKRVWPVWPVGAGEMTEHGAKALGLMADYLRAIYVAKGALPATGCPIAGTVDVWADVADHRTRQSGDIFADRLAPGCGLASRHAKDSTTDPLFNAMDTKACAVGMFDRARALFDAARESGGLVRPEERGALEAVQTVLAPGACKPGGLGVCLVPAPDASTAEAATSLTLGAVVAEGLYLEYVEGLPLADVGWGNVKGAATIDAVMPAFNRGIAILRRTPSLAARRGAVMARTIVALLQAKPLPEGAPTLAAASKLVMLAGHDSNLLYMAGLMGLDWQLKDQPSVTAPDTTLAFELWRTPGGAQTVKVVVYAQTLAQLREASPLDAANPPNVVAVTPAVCGEASDGCTLDAFAAGVGRRLADLCGG